VPIDTARILRHDRDRGGGSPVRGRRKGGARRVRPAPVPRPTGSPARAEPMAEQATAKGPLELAAAETKRYAARIAKDPKACPMFPVINEGNGMLETLCYVQGYLAGLVAAAGQSPTKAEMDELVYDTINDPNVSEMATRMQADIVPVSLRCPPSEL